jgi:hypothetical protein
MEPVLSKKNQFLSNPTINPDTKENVVVGSNEYKQLEKKYGEPHKIKSPKSHKLISVNKGEYKKLIKEGYTDKQLFNQSTLTPLYTIKNKTYTEDELIHMIEFFNKHHQVNELPKETWEEILLRTNVNDLEQACLTNKITNKICHNINFWKQLFNQYQIPFWVDPSLVKSISDWVNIINKLLYSKKYAYMLIDLLKYLQKNNVHDFFDIMYTNSNIGDMDKVLINYQQDLVKMKNEYNQLDNQDDADFVLDFRYENGEYSFNYTLQDEDGDAIEGIYEDKLTKDDMIDLLMKWFYYVYITPEETNLVDGSGFSYFYEQLLESMSENFKPKDYKQQQYKQLKLRLDYLKNNQ